MDGEDVASVWSGLAGWVEATAAEWSGTSDSGTRPVACSHVGGGERGGEGGTVVIWGKGEPVGVVRSDSSRVGGDVALASTASNVGGKRLVADVGNGNAGGASEDSGRSATR